MDAPLKQLGNMLTQANQIAPGLTLRCRTIAGNDGRNQRCVPGLDERRQVTMPEGDPDEKVTLVPDGFGESHTPTRARKFVQNFIPSTISMPQLYEPCTRFIGQSCRRRQSGAPTLEVVRFNGRSPLGGQTSDDALGGTENLVEVPHFRWNGADDAAADLGQYFEKSFDRETADRVCNRRATYGQDTTNPFGRNLVTWIEPATEQQAFQICVRQVVKPRCALPQAFRRVGENDIEESSHGVYTNILVCAKHH